MAGHHKKQPTGRDRLVIDASYVAAIHTYLALVAFGSALLLGCALHFKKIVRNGVAGYPENGFHPIGDWYPERNLFQILIAITSGPRFSIVFLQYLLNRQSQSSLPGWLFLFGIIRTLSCGGWVYITSSDDHDVHDVLMILYILCNVPWMLGGIHCTRAGHTESRRRRKLVATLYHKVYKIPGAYTRYSFFEWGLILLDILYDSIAGIDFERSKLQIMLGTCLDTNAGGDSILVLKKFVTTPQLRSILGFMADVYCSYLFWSIATSLLTTLFYFSIWELGFSGSEAALLVYSLTRRVALRLLSLVGLAAYVLNDPVTRLFVVGSANLVNLMSHCADWMACPDAYQGLLLGLGLILSSLSKHANHSNNPVWANAERRNRRLHKMGIALALLALLELGTRSPAPPRTSTRSQKDTIIAWSWTGYEFRRPRGPLPHLYGAVTIMAQSLGLLIPVVLPSRVASTLLTHIAWFAYGCASAFVMYNFRNWLGFAGGLNFAVFCMSITPSVLSRAAMSGAHNPGRTLFVAFFLAIVFYVSSVFTVAYAFVPGGVYFRERTDLWPNTKFPNLVLHSIILEQTAAYTVALLAVLSFTSVLVTIFHRPVIGPSPYKPGTRILNAGIWTVHFGFDNAGRDSQRRMRDVIRDMQLDVVGLLETDLHVSVQTRVIAEELGYYVDLGPGPNMHTWGAALLSKLAPAIEATLDVYGTEVTVVISHNGQEEDALDRELQSKELAHIMAKLYPRPVIFLGYVVTKPHASRRTCLLHMTPPRNDGLMYDIDPHDMDRWCEYILYRGLYRTAYARVSQLQIGQFVVPKHGFNLIDQTEESRLLRAWKEELPEDHWLPMEYYGNEQQGGVNGHYYHVFGTPLYYKLPEDAHV
ncbi:Frag1/DRAM/Sfk1 family-domain-containing protein [Pisolithus marmoratus]|nr:Frag1/DRAM/Sfk1 family-domain-containing protein [Pisolithus marmoratus]